jgi:methyl-accepting chemotaxis protein
VVAHEVKALAEQTAKATGEIGQNVSTIQSSTAARSMRCAK